MERFIGCAAPLGLFIGVVGATSVYWLGELLWWTGVAL